jgi:tRNA nucleotidyltransferase (CCA-adding enzyme)
VRDLLLGRESPDIDVAVESRASEFGAMVARELGGRFVFHRRFLTGTVRLPDGHIDIAQARTETYARPGNLPDVSPAGIEPDLLRRDFAINAIALELTPGSLGRLVDPLHGRRDLRQRRVRVLHEQSFADDPTRVFRCIRFAVRFGFAVEPRTLALLREAVRCRTPALLTPERLLGELRLICAESLVLPMVEAVCHERVLESALDWQRPRGFFGDLAKLVRGRATPDLLFIWLLGKLPLTDRFPITTAERDAAATLRRAATITALLRRARKPSAVHRALHALPEPAVRVMALLAAGPARRRINGYLNEYRHVRPRVSGRELRALGIRPGPLYAQLLNRLLCARLDGTIRTMADELAFCRRLARKAGVV